MVSNLISRVYLIVNITILDQEGSLLKRNDLFEMRYKLIYKLKNTVTTKKKTCMFDSFHLNDLSLVRASWKQPCV